MRLIVLLASLLIVITACQGPPATQIYIVVTATPGADSPSPGPLNLDAAAEQTQEPEQTPTPALTPTPDPFPAPVISQVYVAEQRFENGRMFWLQPTDQIWVMVNTEDGQGIWLTYDDTFEEGDVEFDPTIVPPENLYQPVRGFGALWRSNLEVRRALGWAIELEFDHVSPYEYHFNGIVDENNEFTKEPGYHLLGSLYGDIFRFDEATSTWQRVGE